MVECKQLDAHKKYTGEYSLESFLTCRIVFFLMAQKGDFQEVNIFKIKIKYCAMYNILVVMNKNTILIAINKYLFNH